MSNRNRIIIGILLAANLIAGGLVFARRYSSRAPDSLSESGSLPSLDIRDDSGRSINTNQFLGSPLFVQFVNPYVDAQIASVIKARQNRPDRSITWLLVTKDARELRERLPEDSGDIIIVESDYEKLRELLNVPKCCERWLIFDESAKLRTSGDYDSGDVAARLRSVIDGERPYSEAVIWQAFNSLKKRDLAQIIDRGTRSRSRKALIVMLSSVCTGCADGELVDLLNVYAKQSPEISFLALVPDTFSHLDVKNLIANLDLSFPVEIANHNLSREWALYSARA